MVSDSAAKGRLVGADTFAASVLSSQSVPASPPLCSRCLRALVAVIATSVGTFGIGSNGGCDMVRAKTQAAETQTHCVSALAAEAPEAVTR